MNRLQPIHCLVGIIAAVVLIVVLGPSADTVVLVAVALACPLVMLLMMRRMEARDAERPKDDRPVSPSR